MTTFVNPREAVLDNAPMRVIIPENVAVLPVPATPVFSVSADGVPAVDAIAIDATVFGWDGPVTWSITGGVLSDITARSATLTYQSMTGDVATVVAKLMDGTTIVAENSCIIAVLRGASGASVVKLLPSAQVFAIKKDGTNDPTSILLKAIGQNTSGTPNFTIPVGTATLAAGSSAFEKLLTFANMSTDVVTIEVDIGGQKDRVTIVKVREGSDSINSFLTNESVTLPASSTGVVTNVTGAVCTMKVYRGILDDTANWGFAYAPASAANRLEYTTGAGASAGTVTVSSMATGVDAAYVDITASRTGYTSITKRFSITKSKDGAKGADGTGQRGSVQSTKTIAGTAWSDTEANNAIFNAGYGSPVRLDVVTLNNPTVGMVETRAFDGMNWITFTQLINGNFLVNGSVLTQALAADSITAEKIKAGEVRASHLAVGDSDNLIRDTRFKDLVWWGVGPGSGHNVTVGDWGTTQATVWKDNCSLYFYSSGNVMKEVLTREIQIQPGARYYFEYQISFSADFDGEVTIEWFWPGVTWYGFGVPNTIYTWADGGPIQYPSNSRGLKQVTGEVVMSSDPRCVKTAIRTRYRSRAGSFEIGGWRIVRQVDSTLIGPGSVQTKHLTIATGGAISSGQTGYDQGDGFWLEGNLPGQHGARVSVGSGGARLTFDSGTQTLKVKGTIEGSLILASVLSLESARIRTTEDRLAPFTVFDSGMQFADPAKSMAVTLDGFKGPGWDSLYVYHVKRFARYKMDVNLKATVHGNGGFETLQLQVAYNNGSWVNIVSPRAQCDYLGGFSVSVRYTTIDTPWEFIKFRAITVEGHTLSLCFEVQVFNFNDSANVAGSNSGISNADSSGSGGYEEPAEPWCVDYETTHLPTGRFVRDLRINDLVEIWNDNAASPGVEYAPVQRIAFGDEQSYMLRTVSGAAVIQSRSTPMTLRDGRVTTTDHMLGEDVLVKRNGSLAWEPVVEVLDVGMRSVVKVSLGDRMYFAGINAGATIATHNMQYKP